jgi:preprotein translocase subunit SecE
VKKIINFVFEAKDELSKVSWPSKDEVTRFTVVTVVTLFIFSVFLWAVDIGLMAIVNFVMR